MYPCIAVTHRLLKIIKSFIPNIHPGRVKMCLLTDTPISFLFLEVYKYSVSKGNLLNRIIIIVIIIITIIINAV